MARMIPSYCATNSPGEKEIFSLLRDSSETVDWVVLHSLHIARHEKKVKGEADFVLLIPNRGLVVLEVKSHSKVDFKEGSWFLGNALESSESPFVQAESAMFSIRKHLIQALPQMRRLTFVSMCWFTEIDFPKKDSFEWSSWQVLNARDKKNPVDAILSAYSMGVKHLQKKLSSTIPITSDFNTESMESVIEVLRPNFEFTLSEKGIRENRRVELINYASEQFACLDLFSGNERVVFRGAAGTGKTVLSIEMAKRQNVQGKKTLLVCFNRFLMCEIKKSLSGTSVQVRTIDSLILEFAKRRYPHLSRNPIEALSSIAYSDLELMPDEQFECMIIDEAQDVFQQKYLGFLNKLILGGLNLGCWHAFGDFDSQRMFTHEDGQKELEEFSKNHAVGSLTVNCRNVIQIGHFVQGILPNVPKWSAFRRSEVRPDPELIVIPDGFDVVPFIDKAIDSLLAVPFGFDDICILTPSNVSDPEYVFSHSRYANFFANYDPDVTGKIRFASIGKFKGLESASVIALDIDTMNQWNNRVEMLYVLLTRPTDQLLILASESARQMLIESSTGELVNDRQW